MRVKLSSEFLGEHSLQTFLLHVKVAQNMFNSSGIYNQEPWQRDKEEPCPSGIKKNSMQPAASYVKWMLKIPMRSSKFDNLKKVLM